MKKDILFFVTWIVFSDALGKIGKMYVWDSHIMLFFAGSLSALILMWAGSYGIWEKKDEVKK